MMMIILMNEPGLPACVAPALSLIVSSLPSSPALFTLTLFTAILVMIKIMMRMTIAEIHVGEFTIYFIIMSIN